ncbi:hypothetical protein BOTBODRAFT_49263 [Botryobasidium botryosum FD-172 SS1]|uniref:DNA 3'-5' helicase n=1 Tax=Botryobasidium botryosum (strain FD-172 SS1) TaxID=930990 RepID=A0A067M509_BOTB1|nr:hypothetical protein BOTBODRAFT_49263 [Botryobasidium botryosum FD-172 SS1]
MWRRSKQSRLNPKRAGNHAREPSGYLLVVSVDAFFLTSPPILPASMPLHSRPFGPQTVREAMREATIAITGLEPHEEQLDVAVAIYYNRDVVLIAGTGWGKTLAFIMPCFLDKKITIIIVSPLNALEDNQAQRFQEWGLKATAVNSATRKAEWRLIKAIAASHFQVVVTSPENLLSPDCLRPVLTKLAFAQHAKIIVDEAHCICLWGPKFRPCWGRLGEIQSLVPFRVPFLLATATATPSMITEMTKSVHMRAGYLFVNLGNFRPNLVWEVEIMKERSTLQEQVGFLIPENSSLANFLVDECVLLYVNSRAAAHKLAYALCKLLPSTMRHTVEIFHAIRGPLTKAWILYKIFNKGLRILICTKAAGMGCDFPNIRLVVQYMAPDNMISWIQRGGRGGRDSTRCRCLLLVEPGIVKKKTTKNASGKCVPIEPVEYSKACDDVMHQYILTEECRWKFIDNHFQNPGHGHK